MSGNGVEILTAPGGAGKTFALATAREAWARAGFRVIGAAHTGVTADDSFEKRPAFHPRRSPGC